EPPTPAPILVRLGQTDYPSALAIRRINLSVQTWGPRIEFDGRPPATNNDEGSTELPIPCRRLSTRQRRIDSRFCEFEQLPAWTRSVERSTCLQEKAAHHPERRRKQRPLRKPHAFESCCFLTTGQA